MLLTPRTQIARNVNYCSAIGIHRRLYQADARIIVAAEPVSFQNGVLCWRNVFTGRVREIPNVGLFLWSTPRIANDAAGPTVATSRRRYAFGWRLRCAAQSALRHPRRRSCRHNDLMGVER